MVRRGVGVTCHALLALVAAAFALAGCGGDKPGSGAIGSLSDSRFVSQIGRTDVDITVVDNAFDPRYIKISAGTTLTFNNTGRNAHNIVPVEVDAFKGVDLDAFGPGEVATITFEESGDFAYYCSIHGTPKNGQNGTIRVVDK